MTMETKAGPSVPIQLMQDRLLEIERGIRGRLDAIPKDSVTFELESRTAQEFLQPLSVLVSPYCAEHLTSPEHREALSLAINALSHFSTWIDDFNVPAFKRPTQTRIYAEFEPLLSEPTIQNGFAAVKAEIQAAEQAENASIAADTPPRKSFGQRIKESLLPPEIPITQKADRLR